jgi:hypothetical protein
VLVNDVKGESCSQFCSSSCLDVYVLCPYNRVGIMWSRTMALVGLLCGDLMREFFICFFSSFLLWSSSVNFKVDCPCWWLCGVLYW